MTEEEWLGCSFPQGMLEFLNGAGRATDRQLRLFACACCRRIWDMLPDEASRAAVQAAERFADGLATGEELQVCYRAARAVSSAVSRKGVCDPYQFTLLAASDTTYPSAYSAATSATVDAAWHPVRDETIGPIRVAEWALQAGLLRDLFGNPFRPVTLDPSWITSTVLVLAQGIYDDRAFDQLPILADALQDAGCDNADVLNHCRSEGPHCRGCWLVDQILGKS